MPKIGNYLFATDYINFKKEFGITLMEFAYNGYFQFFSHYKSYNCYIVSYLTILSNLLFIIYIAKTNLSIMKIGLLFELQIIAIYMVEIIS